MKRLTVWLQEHMIVVIIAFALFAPFVVYFTATAVLRYNVRPPPIRYLAKPQQVVDPVCPGDAINYYFRFEIDEGAVPVALTIERGIWSLGEGRFVVGPAFPMTYPYNRAAVIERTSSYEIPELADNSKAFPPGDYLLSVTGESEGRETVGFEIPFTIADHCPKAG